MNKDVFVVNKIFIAQEMTSYLLDIFYLWQQYIVSGPNVERAVRRMDGLVLVIVVVLGTRFMAPRGFQDGNCFDFITLFQHIDQTSAQCTGARKRKPILDGKNSYMSR